jgi:hypothetical protein
MITAEAPAACAFSAFAANVHVPRWTSAMLPAGKPAKSAASQPLVTGSRGMARTTSTAVTLAATTPEPEPVYAPVS